MQLLILLMETVQTMPWSENCLKKKWQKSLLLTVVGILLEILWDLLWDKDYCQKVWIRLIFNLCWK